MSSSKGKPAVKSPKPRSVSFAPRPGTSSAATTSIATSHNSNKTIPDSQDAPMNAPSPGVAVPTSHHHHHRHGRSREQHQSQDTSSSEEYSTSPSPDSSIEEYNPAVGAYNILQLPENVIETIFTFLPLFDLRTVSFVCSTWGRIINDEQNEVWKSLCLRKIHPEVFQSGLLDHLGTYKSKLRAFYHSWNPNDCSRNIYVKPNGFTIHRNPVAQSTDGVRGKRGFNRGRHAWEVIWEGPLGTVAVVGVATRRAEMRAQGYVPLLGQDEHSWGWNLVENSLLHSGDSHGNFPVINNAPRYQVGEKIRVILDCEDNSLSFEKDYEFLGVAFRGLPTQEPLYPAISAVYGNTEVSMVYLGAPLDG